MMNLDAQTTSARPPRILYVYNVLWFFMSHRRHLARAAQKEGYEVHVAARVEDGNAEMICADGMFFHPISLTRRGVNPLTEAATIWELYKLYSTIKPDLIEHATIKPVLYGSLITKLFRRTRVVNWMTGLGFVFTAGGVKKSFYRAFVKAMYKFVFSQPLLKILFENYDDQKFFLSSNIINENQSVVIRGAGVDMNFFMPSPEPLDNLSVILPGRMLWDKGIKEFVEAAMMLKHQGVSNVRFILVGDIDTGNPTSIEQKILEKWKADGDVEWWGKSNDMASVFAQAHIVCLPSYREGLPKVLVEAAAAGRPIVTTNVPGCREVVINGANGILVPPKDSKALAAALLKLIENKSLREQMGHKGREIVLHAFSEKSVISKTLSTYKELLSR